MRAPAASCSCIDFHDESHICVLQHVERQREDCESWLAEGWDKLDKSMYKQAILFFRNKSKE